MNDTLKMMIGTILANTMLIMQGLRYDKDTPVDLLEQLNDAIDTSDNLLGVFMEELVGDSDGRAD